MALTGMGNEPMIINQTTTSMAVAEVDTIFQVPETGEEENKEDKINTGEHCQRKQPHNI